MPSPQVGSAQPAWHVSPSMTLPSSHPSSSSRTPLPQVSSEAQSRAQPSPSSALPSSHISPSASSITRSPQRGCSHTPARHRPASPPGSVHGSPATSHSSASSTQPPAGLHARKSGHTLPSLHTRTSCDRQAALAASASATTPNLHELDLIGRWYPRAGNV
jgi:hypothetical protein